MHHCPELFIDFSCATLSYLSSTGLVLDVVNRTNLGADVLQVQCWCVDGSGGPGSTRSSWLFIHGSLLGHRGFGNDPTAVTGISFSVGGSSRGSRSGR